jgi:hypothetical protein
MKYSAPKVHDVGLAEEIIQGIGGDFTESLITYKMTPQD